MTQWISRLHTECLLKPLIDLEFKSKQLSFLIRVISQYLQFNGEIGVIRRIENATFPKVPYRSLLVALGLIHSLPRVIKGS